jgi:hypothetical protein
MRFGRTRYQHDRSKKKGARNLPVHFEMLATWAIYVAPRDLLLQGFDACIEIYAFDEL